MSEALLLDTCAAIWWSAGTSLSQATRNAIDRSASGGVGVFVSPISAWEVALMSARGNNVVAAPPLTWFEAVAGLDGLRETELSAPILVASWALPGGPPRDPADRILIATARELGLTLVTRDRAILGYAGQGHLRALPC